MIAAIPLMIFPLIAYNALVFGPFEGAGLDILSMDMVSISMISGAQWSMQLGDLVIVGALVLLFLEILKATRSGSWSVIDHLLSAVVFVAFLIEFLTVGEAATDIFFILTVIAFVDLIAGFSVSIKSAGRDVSIGL
ncbi:hypothetical protein [Hoeflea prorocentri]|uniref:Uncharacterized protein n=1 Tax=Hoeflea prorocentri TaxID=1922333 RepID=A0A9X3UQI5_9HYPH|nr:hypothetical protein [Hoeflea prorocentri]MCY6383524.1 hypothetical protein [Hoeflea prorocentri]MDA5401324.1 hypothetical protein [Hoeflea prorocentri]